MKGKKKEGRKEKREEKKLIIGPLSYLLTIGPSLPLGNPTPQVSFAVDHAVFP